MMSKIIDLFLGILFELFQHYNLLLYKYLMIRDHTAPLKFCNSKLNIYANRKYFFLIVLLIGMFQFDMQVQWNLRAVLFVAVCVSALCHINIYLSTRWFFSKSTFFLRFRFYFLTTLRSDNSLKSFSQIKYFPKLTSNFYV